MPTQTITIHLKHDSFEAFRILNIYQTEDGKLWVVSKLSHAADYVAGVNDGMINVKREITLNVSHPMPVEHFMIGLPSDCNNDCLPDVLFTRIACYADLPNLGKLICLYAHPYSEEQELKEQMHGYDEERKHYIKMASKLHDTNPATAKEFTAFATEQAAMHDKLQNTLTQHQQQKAAFNLRVTSPTTNGLKTKATLFSAPAQNIDDKTSIEELQSILTGTYS